MDPGGDRIDEGKSFYVVYGSHSLTGYYHSNEDRFSVATATSWPFIRSSSLSRRPNTNSALALQSQESSVRCESDVCPKSSPIPELNLQLGPTTLGSGSEFKMLSRKHQQRSVQGFGSTDCTAIHIEKSSKFPTVEISSEKVFIFTVCDGHDSDVAAEYVNLHCASVIQKTWYRGLKSMLARLNGNGEDDFGNTVAPSSSMASARLFLGESWQATCSSNTEMEASRRRLHLASFHKAFGEIESGFRSYIDTLTSRTGLPECTAGTVRCVVITALCNHSFCLLLVPYLYPDIGYFHLVC